jgi:hypothetical protein
LDAGFVMVNGWNRLFHSIESYCCRRESVGRRSPLRPTESSASDFLSPMSVCAAALVVIVSSIAMSTFLNIFISTAKIRKESQITQISSKNLPVSANLWSFETEFG